MDKGSINDQIGLLLRRLGLLALLWLVNSSGCVFLGQRAVNWAVKRAVESNTRQILDRLDVPDEDRKRWPILHKPGTNAAACGREKAPLPIRLFIPPAPELCEE